MNPRIRILFLLAALPCSTLVRADIYKCVDEAGHVTYTNNRPSGKGCSTLARDQAVSSVPSAGMPRSAVVPLPQNGASSAAGGFPRVDSGTQKARDSDRRRILEDELGAEQKALAAALKELDEQGLGRYGNDGNAPAGGGRGQAVRDRVQLHERNVEALRREIANLR